MKNQIFIADDEEMICSILMRSLTQEGYSCLTANIWKKSISLKTRFLSFAIIMSISMAVVIPMD